MAGQAGTHAGPVRNFRGYGRHTPPVRWPGDASLVVNIVLNYESGAEYSLPGRPAARAAAPAAAAQANGR
jgi:hypothetical protein